VKDSGTTMAPPGPRLLRHARGTIQVLAQNAAHQFAAQHALAIYAADAIYSFIPKNACSTMRYTLGLANGAIAGPAHFDWIHSNNLTFRASLAELAKARYTFVILRDPYRRIASCYLDQLVEQTAVAWQYHVATNYQTRPAMLTFRGFVTNLRSRLRGNEHWRPQLDFLVYENYDDVFCREAFSDAAAALRDRIGLEVQDARRLTKHGSGQFRPLDGDECFADRPVHEIAALKRTGRMPRTEQLYDASLIAEVGQMDRVSGRPVPGGAAREARRAA
jgi:Sulfotransferase family